MFSLKAIISSDSKESPVRSSKSGGPTTPKKKRTTIEINHVDSPEFEMERCKNDWLEADDYKSPLKTF